MAKLCSTCRIRDAVEGGKTCVVCRERQRASYYKRQERLAKEGLCRRCGKVPPLEGITYCQTCRDLNNARHKVSSRKRYLRRCAEGLCIKCGKRKAEHGCMCEPCYERCEELRMKRRERL